MPSGAGFRQSSTPWDSFAMAMILVVAGFCVLALDRRVRAVRQP
ncbi:hypothetical protein [Rhodococcus koreensis]